MCDWFGFCVPQSSNADLPNEVSSFASASNSFNKDSTAFTDVKPIYQENVPLAGIGIALHSTDGETLVVHSLTAGGPAQLCGVIHRGDQLLSVNGVNVQGMSQKELAKHLIGPIDSRIRIGFRRSDQCTKQQKDFWVELRRARSIS